MIENHAIEFIPEKDRHGKPFSLFKLWFTGNMQIVTVAVGVLPIQMGLSVAWSFLAVVIGNLIGGLIMAAHAVQGPKIGIPQMIQSRAQFGVLGANIPIAVVVIEYLGFFILNDILGEKVLIYMLAISPSFAVFLSSIISLSFFFIGYNAFHRYAKLTTYIYMVVFAVASIIELQNYSYSPITAPTASDPMNLSMWFMIVTVTATWQITYGPYVADYSRYLPINTSSSAIFCNTYLGTVIGSIWAMGLGILLSANDLTSATKNPTVAFADLFTGHSDLQVCILLLLFSGIIFGGSVNLYGFSLSSLTILSTNKHISFSIISFGKLWRVILGITGAVIGTLLAILAEHGIISYINDLLLILMPLFAPWSAINLTDFFILSHGNYDIPAIYDKNGRYGSWGMPALISFIFSVFIEIIFIRTPFYTGFLANALGGINISFVAGLISGCAVYIFLKWRALK